MSVTHNPLAARFAAGLRAFALAVVAWCAAPALSPPILAQTAPSPWQGEWSGPFGTLKMRVQDGLAYGDYIYGPAPEQTGRIVGVVGTDGSLKGTYFRDGTAAYFSFTQPTAGQFQGTSSVINLQGAAAAPAPGSWAGSLVRAGTPRVAGATGPADKAAKFAGNWQTTFGDVRLHAFGGLVIGDYRDLGVVVGQIDGSSGPDVLQGVFNNGPQAGSFSFAIPAGQAGAWDGRWKWAGEPALRAANDPWNGTRQTANPAALRNMARNTTWQPPARTVNVAAAGDECGSGWNATFVPDGIFLPACQTHDACYRGQVKTQSQCDREFLQDTRAACSRHFSSTLLTVSRELCYGAARVYFWAVAGTLGSNAYGGGEIGGRIVGMTATTLRGNEQEGCVRIRNPTRRVMEYDVTMFAADGTQLDQRPRFSEQDIQPGREEIICVNTTSYPRDRSDIGRTFSMVVRLDDPDAGVVSGITGSDWVTVDRAICTVATNRCTRG